MADPEKKLETSEPVETAKEKAAPVSEAEGREDYARLEALNLANAPED